MSYSSITVAQIVKKLNIQYFLPAIQREFVWGEDRVISLFDSIMKNYPISSFLFWQVEYENRDKWGIYKLTENANPPFSHNELANVSGVREPILVIDGQQRLTSFLIGLKGSFTVKKKGGRIKDPNSWKKHYLYLNLLKDPSVEESDDLVSPSYGFEFFNEPPSNDDTQYWFKVAKILDYGNEKQFLEFKQLTMRGLPANLNNGQRVLFETNLDLLYNSIWRSEVINFYLETKQEFDRVLDVFVRANERGKPLDRSDLLLSIITSKWGSINAKYEVHTFVQKLNKLDIINYTSKNNFNEDFIMKNCLVLADLPVAYKVQSYTEKNLALMETNWSNLKDSTERCVNCINSFGIDGTNLTAKNAVIPIIYYFYQNPGLTLMTTRASDVNNAKLVRRWLIASLLNKVFGGSSDSILSSIRQVLKDNPKKSEFPMATINKKIIESGRRGDFGSNEIDEFLSIRYSDKEVFLALSLLYDDNNWGDKQINIDHIFPKDMFDFQNMQSAGLANLWVSYDGLYNDIGNLEILTQEENLEKLNKPFDKWIQTRAPGFKTRHLIPDDPKVWGLEFFEEFLNQRNILIADKLDLLFK